MCMRKMHSLQRNYVYSKYGTSDVLQTSYDSSIAYGTMKIKNITTSLQL